MTATNIRLLVQAAGNDERRTMLRELADALRWEDRLLLSTLLSQKNDPARQLPTELMIHIFGYLPLFDAWRLQLVCKSWHLCLSADATQRALLARWETHSPADSARSCEQQQQQSVTDMVRHMRAWCLNLPFSTAKIQTGRAVMQRGLQSQAQRTLALSGGQLAFLDSDAHLGDVVVVRNLLSEMPDYRLRPAARERIMALALTKKLVACLTFAGKMYVQALPDTSGPLKAITLPSSSVTAFHADDNVIGLTVGNAGGPTGSLLLYSHATGRMAQQTIRYPSPTETAPVEGSHSPPANASPGVPRIAPSSMLVNETTGTTDLFYSSEVALAHGTDDQSEFLWFAHQRYHNKPGQLGRTDLAAVEQEDVLRLPMQPDLIRLEGGALAAPHPTGLRSQWAFSTSFAKTMNHVRPLTCMIPMFDAKKGKLYRQHYPFPEHYSPQDIRRLSIWKGAVHTHPRLSDITPIYKIRDDASPTEGLPPSRRWVDAVALLGEAHGEVQEVALNDSFLVLKSMSSSPETSSSHITIWCFESNFNWRMDGKTEVWDWDLNEMANKAKDLQDPHGTTRRHVSCELPAELVIMSLP